MKKIKPGNRLEHNGSEVGYSLVSVVREGLSEEVLAELKHE